MYGPDFTPGPLTVAQAERLNRLAGMLHRLEPGNLRAATPLCLRDDPTGVSFYVESGALADSLGPLLNGGLQTTKTAPPPGSTLQNGVTSTGNTFRSVDDVWLFSFSTLDWFSSQLSFTGSQVSASGITFNAAKNNYTGVIFNNWLEICGDLFLCCETYTFASGTVQDWQTPAPATMYPVTPFAGGTTLESIIPAGAGTLRQVTTPAFTDSANSLTASFPFAVGAGSTVLVHTIGKTTGTMSAQAVVDSASNSYTKDAFARHTLDGVYAGVFRFSNVSAADTFSVTFSYSGLPGPIEVWAEEVSGLNLTSPVDGSSTATGNSSAPAPGSLTPANPYEYLVMTMAADPGAATSITTPTDFINLGSETAGQGFIIGSADEHGVSATTAVNPSYTLPATMPWAAAMVSYKTKPGPQVVGLTNNSATDGLTLVSGGAATSGLGQVFFLPPVYGGTVSLAQYDTILLWFDGCDGDGWRVLDCTVLPGAGNTIFTRDKSSHSDAATSSITFNGFIETAPGTGSVTIGAAGSSTDVQYNNSGAMAGNASFTYNGSTAIVVGNFGTSNYAAIGAKAHAGGTVQAAAAFQETTFGSTTDIGYAASNCSMQTTGGTNGSTSCYVKFCDDGTGSGDTNGYAVDAQRGSVKTLGSANNTYRWGTNTTAPSTTGGVTLPTTVYGGTTKLLGDPTDWVLIDVNGTTRKVPVY